MAKHSNPKSKTCLYRARPEDYNGCNYIFIEKHSRGCSVEECDKYINDARRRKHTSIVFGKGVNYGEKQ